MTINIQKEFLPLHYENLFNNLKEQTYILAVGSRASGKSYAVAHYLVLKQIEFWVKYKISLSILVIRQWQVNHKNSTRSEIVKAIEDLRLSKYYLIPKGENTITCNLSKGQFLFRGLDDAQSLKSVRANNGSYLSYIWFEEASQIKYNDFIQADLSIRGIFPEPLTKKVFITSNPDRPTHWIKKEFIDKPSQDLLYYKSCYLDNNFLSKQDIRIFETMKINNPKRYQSDGLGEFVNQEGLVFTNWEISPTCPNTCNYRVTGIDLGFNDPTAIISGLVDKQNYIIYIDKEFVRSKLTNRQIANQIVTMDLDREGTIFADSEDPRTINEIKLLGIKNIYPCKKGPNSVVQGIRKLQDYKIIINPECEEFIKAIQNYSWELDKDGNATDKPEHSYSHCLDSLRYSIQELGTRYSVLF